MYNGIIDYTDYLKKGNPILKDKVLRVVALFFAGSFVIAGSGKVVNDALVNYFQGESIYNQELSSLQISILKAGALSDTDVITEPSESKFPKE